MKLQYLKNLGLTLSLVFVLGACTQQQTEKTDPTDPNIDTALNDLLEDEYDDDIIDDEDLNGEASDTNVKKAKKDIGSLLFDAYSFLKDAQPVAGQGLENLGASCYANSSWKVLFSIPQMPELLAQEHLSSDFIGDTQDLAPEQVALRQNLLNIYQGIQTQENTDELNRNFFNTFGNRLNANPELQMDSNEFLGFLLNEIEYQRFYPVFRERRLQVFDSGLVQKSSRADALPIISLPVEKANHTPIKSVQDALKTYFAFETATVGNFSFNSVSHKNEPGKAALILTLPERKPLRPNLLPNHLILQLRRYQVVNANQTKKLAHKILLNQKITVEAFPENVNAKRLLKHIEGKAIHPRAKTLQFQLSAIIVHEGISPRAGHYVAFTREKSGNWYYHNDSQVFQLTSEGFRTALRGHVAKNAYMLVYTAIPEKKKVPSTATPTSHTPN